jgi:DeoR family glycerol-3-phosphate regulon repressor
MRPHERQLQIADLVRNQGKASVEQLALNFATSAETIRRDLTILAANGKLRKVHGAALALRDYGEGLFAQRMQLNADAKRQIADKARALVTPGDTLFIDTGSTTLLLAQALGSIDNLTIVTNSTAIAAAISSGNDTASVYLLGGTYRQDNRQTCGAMALNQIAGFHANLAILTVAAVSAETGMMDFSDDEANIARAMIAHAERSIVLADASKFDRTAPFVVASISQVGTLVCDRIPGGLLNQRLEQAGVSVI